MNIEHELGAPVITNREPSITYSQEMSSVVCPSWHNQACNAPDCFQRLHDRSVSFRFAAHKHGRAQHEGREIHVGTRIVRHEILDSARLDRGCHQDGLAVVYTSRQGHSKLPGLSPGLFSHAYANSCHQRKAESAHVPCHTHHTPARSPDSAECIAGTRCCRRVLCLQSPRAVRRAPRSRLGPPISHTISRPSRPRPGPASSYHHRRARRHCISRVGRSVRAASSAGSAISDASLPSWHSDLPRA